MDKRQKDFFRKYKIIIYDDYQYKHFYYRKVLFMKEFNTTMEEQFYFATTIEKYEANIDLIMKTRKVKRLEAAYIFIKEKIYLRGVSP